MTNVPNNKISSFTNSATFFLRENEFDLLKKENKNLYKIIRDIWNNYAYERTNISREDRDKAIDLLLENHHKEMGLIWAWGRKPPIRILENWKGGVSMSNRRDELRYRIWRDREVLRRLPGRPTEWQLRKEYLADIPTVKEADIILNK